MSPSAKGTRHVPESSNNFISPNLHLKSVIAPERSGSASGANIDTEEKENTKSRSKKFRNIGLTALSIAAGGALAATLAVGLNSGEQTQGSQPPKAPETSQSNEDKPATIPAEAQEFVNAYKDTFQDPLATYYAEKAYLEASPTNNDLTIGDEYVTTYNFEATPDAAVSPLGYEILKLTPGEEVTAENSANQFNRSIPDMNLLINMLSKNPRPDQISVISDEFKDYAGFYNSSSQQLVDTLAGVAEKYGSNAVYTINEATTNEAADQNTATIFENNQPVIDNVDEEGAVDAFNSPSHLSITVVSYDDKGTPVTTTEVIQDFQFSVARASNADPFNVGLIGIGAK